MTSKEIDPKGQRVSAFCLCSLFSSFVYFVSSLFPSVLFVLLIILSGLFVLILFFVLFVLSCLFCLLRFICMYIYIYYWLRARFRRARKPHVSISFLSFLSFVSLVCSLRSLLFVLTVLLFSSVFFVSLFFRFFSHFSFSFLLPTISYFKNLIEFVGSAKSPLVSKEFVLIVLACFSL